MTTASFKINCDVGESTGNDAELMPYLDACSVACGGHAGNQQTMRDTVMLAVEKDVKVGAHPSFPDKKNFGRKAMDISASELRDSILQQINSLYEVCRDQNVALHHLKPHGALYNLAAKNTETAAVILDALTESGNLLLFAPWNSVIANEAAERGIPVVFEGFADRFYLSNRELVPRTEPKAVITDPQKAAEQVQNIFHRNSLTSITGEPIYFKADTFCIHGDNPAAISLARYLNQIKNEKRI